MLASAYSVITGDEIIVTHACCYIGSQMQGHCKCECMECRHESAEIREAANVCVQALVDSYLNEKPDEATCPFCAEICLRSSQYQRTRSNKVVQNPGSYGAPVLKRASPFSGHPTASALPSWPQAAQTSEAGHLDVRHSCSMPLTMHRHSQGPEKLLDDLLLNQAPPVAQRFEISPELALCPLLAEEAVAAS